MDRGARPRPWRAPVLCFCGGGPWRRVLLRSFAHANVVRFAGPPSLRFVRAACRLRNADFGSFEVSKLELVETDKLLSADGTRSVGRIPLAADPEARILSA